jgi:hypothetical protein
MSASAASTASRVRRARSRLRLRLPRRAQVAQMGRIDRQLARKGAAEHLVRGNQGAQPLVDLAVHALTALLDGLHHEHPDADADQGEDGKPQQRAEHALPRAEIHVAHHRTTCSLTCLPLR